MEPIPEKTYDEALKLCRCLLCVEPANCERADRIAAALHLRDQQLAEARKKERERIVEWYKEIFCPSHGVADNETHARGDCMYCNVANAINVSHIALPEED